MNLIYKELKKIQYLIAKIEEIEKTIIDIEDKIYEESLHKDRSLILEASIFLILISFVVFLMIYLKKYLLVFSAFLLLVSIIFFVYFVYTYKDKRAREKLLNILLTDKLNLESFLETVPNKKALLEKYEQYKAKENI